MPSLLHSDLFPLGYPLILRLVFLDLGPVAFAAPANATWIRAGASGAGGFKDDADGWGGGAAFAFSGEACAGSASFTGQVGDSQHARPSANDVAGDSWIKRGNASILVYADRGRPDGTGGLVANSTGTIRRAGGAAAPNAGGIAAGDDADTYPLGFGGRGASTTRPAWYGGGGGHATVDSIFPTYPAGDGRLVVEFYTSNPGYD